MHGDSSLKAIDVRSSGTGETSRLESGGLFIFIGADAETAWLPPEIALDRRGYVLTGSDMRSAERWALDRDPYLLETSVPGIFACGDVRFGPVKRVAAPVPQGVGPGRWRTSGRRVHGIAQVIRLATREDV